MKILDVRWFTNSRGCVGIARVDVDYEGIKYYISSVSGDSEQMDAQYVADWGSTFPKDAGDVLFEV